MRNNLDLLETDTDPDYPSIVRDYLAVRPHDVVHLATKGQLVLQEGDFADHSMLLLDGWLALSKALPGGETQIIDVMLPGDFALVGARIAPVAACSVEALSDARYLVIRPHQANGAERELAELRELMAAILVTTQARTSELVLRLGKSSAASRIAYALIEFNVRLEVLNLAHDGRFRLPMTQSRIGEFVGLSNVHVCRTMRRFERDGLISHLDQEIIRLNDIDALCRVADIDLETFRQAILLRRPR